MYDRERIIFAADVGSLEELRGYLHAFRGEIGAVKLGMELLTHALFTGEPVFQTVLQESDLKVMWDLKYGDIPDTVKGAAKEVAKYGQGRILGFTVHCSSGPRAIEAAIKAVDENFSVELGTKPLVIPVTLLTSMDQSDLDRLGIAGTPLEVVTRWAQMASDVGARAIVCSPQETSSVLEVNPHFTVINPGIRFKGSVWGGQKRVTPPGEAIAHGARYVVMGFDLRKGNPVANARRAAGEIKATLDAYSRSVPY